MITCSRDSKAGSCLRGRAWREKRFIQLAEHGGGRLFFFVVVVRLLEGQKGQSVFIGVVRVGG